MPIDVDGNPALTGEHERHLEALMEQLDASIARLAITLGVSLEGDQQVTAAMHEEASLTTSASSDHRKSQMHGELRGLIVLRYQLEKSCIEDIGIDNTRALMAQAEQHLQRRGFPAGADGVNLNDLDA